MRLALALALTLSLPVDPAFGCHRFSVWRYPWAQHCKLARATAVREAARGPARGSGPDRAVPAPAPMPPALDQETQRAQAVEALKLKLRGNQ
jgi:hypothetical protein